MISVIITVYNTAKWLSQCLDSVLTQDYKDIEVILVNDASTDNSLSICKKYAAKDSRIMIINKVLNEGSELARCSGFSIAKGEYIMYMDSDDWLNHSHVLSAMYKKAEKTNADYIEIGAQKVLDQHKWIRGGYFGNVFGMIEQPQLFDKYFMSFFGCTILNCSMWGKLYRRSVLEKANIKPLGIFMQDDVAYNMNLFPYLQKIYILNDIGYNYRLGGNTSRYYPFMPDYKKLYCRKKELIEKYSYYKALDYTRFELKNVLKTEICNRIIFRGKTTIDEIIKGIESEIEDPIFLELLEINKSSGFWSEPFAKALLDKDAKQLYEICHKMVRKEWPKRMIKTIGFKVLNMV